jgi:pSer/pThr/pTyr-binding forkhead associated (FHA) protein
MAEHSDTKIEDLTDAVDTYAGEPAALPFRTQGESQDGVISSLDGRPELVETTRMLVEYVGGGSPSPAPAPGAPSRAAGPQPMLVVQPPGGTMETRYAIDSKRFLVGREHCDLELDDRFVSRWHVQLFRRGDALVLQDLGSHNGVYLRIADDLALEDGDQIVVGNQHFEFRTTWDGERATAAAEANLLGATWNGPPVRLIRYVEGGEIGGVYRLGQRMTIGASSSELSLAEDPLLSSPHLVIRRDNDRFVLRDLDSDFGTFIRIADAVELIDGDCFLVGRTRLRLTYA